VKDVASVVIVGGAAAGLATADALHRRGFAGTVDVVSDERVHNYDRPPLSKQVLAGEWAPERATLLPPRRLAELPARIHAGVRATALDVEARAVTTDDGRTLRGDAVVIATGVRPRLLPGRAPAAGVHVLRTLHDALALRERLATPGLRLVVIGGGFLGLETAATARALGAAVTVVEAAPRPLVGRLGAVVAERLLALHAERGVDVRAGVGVAELVGDARVTAVALTDGTTLPADAVLVAIGSQPNVEWLAGSGLSIADGVLCDERCVAAPGVYAAGDVACRRQVGRDRAVRVEHRRNASEQARAVAEHILGERRSSTPVPFFWTDHHKVKVQLAGTVPAGAVEEVVEDDPARGRLVVAFALDGVRTGVVGWNAPDRVTELRRDLAAAAT